jgi:poly(A) polymerase Pap1
VKTTDLTSIWNPKAKTKNVMPIITPAYPPFNSTFNVSKTTKDIILREMRKALKIMKRIRSKTAPWSRLFKKLDFLKAYRFYLKIDVLTNEYDHKRFFGFIESKLKKLISDFERYSTHPKYLIGLHPFMASYLLPDSDYSTCESFFFGLEILPRPDSIEEMVEDIPEEQQNIINLDQIINSFYVGLLPDDDAFQHMDFPKEEFPKNVNLRVKMIKREDIEGVIKGREAEEKDEDEGEMGGKREREDYTNDRDDRSDGRELKRVKVEE